MDRKEVRGLIAGCLIALALLGCDRERPLTVGSKNFAEQLILGEIIAQHLEHRLGRKVARKLNLGGTLLAHQALVNGEIDLYPEYTGTALTAVLKLPPASDPKHVFESVRAEYHTRFRIHWLDPLGFNDTFAMVIRGDDSRRLNIRSLSEAARHSPGWRLGVGYEFQQRPDGLSGLLKTYALPISGTIRTMDLGLLYQALEQKQVDMVAGNTTDGLLSALDVLVLEDDKKYFPPYQAAIAVREEVLHAYPSVADALAELSGKLSDAQMRALNHAVVGQHRPLAEVAQKFLQDAGFRR
jgi:glycine betaine/choline ABC-type transport system substrate-binding protein